MLKFIVQRMLVLHSPQVSYASLPKLASRLMERDVIAIFLACEHVKQSRKIGEEFSHLLELLRGCIFIGTCSDGGAFAGVLGACL